MRSGTQSVERTIRIIKAVAEHGEFGWALSDLARYCKLEKSTVFRILNCLVRERVVRRGAIDERYLPGPLLFELGLSLPTYDAFGKVAEMRLADLSARTKLVAALYYRSGDDSFCAHVAGSGSTRSAISRASRRPLLATSPGIAMLLAMPPRESRAVLGRNLATLSSRREEDIKKLKTMYRLSKKAGMGLHEGNFLPGLNAMALPLLDANGSPFAAVVISALAAEWPRSRFAATEKLLRAEVQTLAREAIRIFSAHH